MDEPFCLAGRLISDKPVLGPDDINLRSFDILEISTALCPYIGYAKSAEIAKKSLKTGVPVKELVLEEGLLQEEELKEILKPEKMTQPMREKVMKAVS